MKNPFSPLEKDFNLPRNATDLSFQNLLTTEWGRITPIMCQEVIPGDSFKISPRIAIQGMPTYFPLQTRCRAKVSIFYGRNRCVWNQFEDFIFHTKEGLTEPWLRMNNERAKKMVSTGSLGDFLGAPSTIGTSTKILQSIHFDNPIWLGKRYGNYVSSSTDILRRYLDRGGRLYDPSGTSLNGASYYSFKYETDAEFVYMRSESLKSPLSSDFKLSFPFTSVGVNTEASLSWVFYLAVLASNTDTVVGYIPIHMSFSVQNSVVVLTQVESLTTEFFGYIDSALSIYGTYRLALCSFAFTNTGDFSPFYSSRTIESSEYRWYVFPYSSLVSVSRYSLLTPNTVLASYVSADKLTDATDDTVISQNRFVGNNPSVPVNALPFRHYEQICNYYFRNDLNNPYVLNNEVQYNEFIPSHDGGADDNVYDFHYHNWELDRFTSAMQSPQFGAAPLVGLTYNGSNTAKFEFQGTDNRTYNATLGVNSDLEIESIVDFDKDIPSANLRQLMDYVAYGISINDFRTGNAFQRFKENAVRRGLRYRNQLMSHLGVKVDYPDIDVPQYIGGFSFDLNTGKTTNTADSPGSGLGDFVGQLFGAGASKNDIYCYCPEHGYIIALMSIVPIPQYPQSIKKYLIKHDAFDYYQHEFSKIGYVPIHYDELCPLQNFGTESPNDVFGYQKAWYDYFQNYDEVHGDFRTTLRDFILGRLFAERPTLSEDFVRVRPEQLNNVFVTQNIADAYGSNAKFMVNAYFSIVAKRIPPVHGTPSLE